MRVFWTIACLCAILSATGCRTFTRSTATTASVEEEERGVLGSLRPRNVRDNVRTAMGRGVDQQAARKAYEDGDALFRQASDAEQGSRKRSGLFGDAAEKYAEAAERYPDSMLQEDALFMKAEAHFFADEYDDAEKAYGELVKAYPNTRHIDRVDGRRFDIAQYWLAVHRKDEKFFLTPNFRNKSLPHNDTFGHAVRVFDKIRLDDPTGHLADDATMAAASAYFTKGDYDQAERFLADLRRTYPESDHQFEAALLAVKAKIEMYQGSDYDSQHLEEAVQLIEITFQQFPEQAKEHREYLEEAYKDARVKLAMRDWRTASFYDYRKEYGAARKYYAKVLQEFPDTSLAQDAQKRLEKIQNFPDKPEQPAQWLVDYIPEHKNQGKPLLSGDPFQWLWR